MLSRFNILSTRKSTSPCFYIYRTKSNENIFYMHEDLNKIEKEHNKKVLEKTSINTIKQGKKLLFRFLKDKNAYTEYSIFIRKVTQYHINDIIKYEFLTPFDRIISYSRRYGLEMENDFIDLSIKWEKFLHSIGYI